MLLAGVTGCKLVLLIGCWCHWLPAGVACWCCCLLAGVAGCLLELLVRRQGEVLPRSLIASQVWDMNFDSDTNVIDVAIRRLRSKIDDDFEPKLIHTVRGMGYKLEVDDEHDVE